MFHSNVQIYTKNKANLMWIPKQVLQSAIILGNITYLYKEQKGNKSCPVWRCDEITTLQLVLF